MRRLRPGTLDVCSRSHDQRMMSRFKLRGCAYRALGPWMLLAKDLGYVSLFDFQGSAYWRTHLHFMNHVRMELLSKMLSLPRCRLTLRVSTPRGEPGPSLNLWGPLVCGGSPRIRNIPGTSHEAVGRQRHCRPQRLPPPGFGQCLTSAPPRPSTWSGITGLNVWMSRHKRFAGSSCSVVMVSVDSLVNVRFYVIINHNLQSTWNLLRMRHSCDDDWH